MIKEILEELFEKAIQAEKDQIQYSKKLESLVIALLDIQDKDYQVLKDVEKYSTFSSKDGKLYGWNNKQKVEIL